MNVQIVNGQGTTASANGLGNLIIGYDEGTQKRTGSHNLVLGEQQSFTSYAGLIGGGLQHAEQCGVGRFRLQQHDRGVGVLDYRRAVQPRG
jgi:hypothetical protein